jgi:hypothetical protein
LAHWRGVENGDDGLIEPLTFAPIAFDKETTAIRGK